MAFDWDDETCIKILKWWNEGVSAGAIVRRLGSRMSRSAVIGKLNRLGASKRSATSIREESRFATRERKPTVVPRIPKKTKHIPIPLDLWADPIVTDEKRPPKLVSFADLEAHHCRYIYGDVGDPDWGYCEQDKIPHLSYCKRHARTCYQPPDKRGNRLKKQPVVYEMEDA